MPARCELQVTDNSPSEKTVASWIPPFNPAAEMQTKYILGLVLSCAILQVSLSECVPGAPSQELVEKYNGMKQTFISRINNFNQVVMSVLRPALESPEVQQAQSMLSSNNPRYTAFINFMEALGREMEPLMDRARTEALGRYETCLRPQFGQLASDVIDTIKIYLDMFFPA